MRLARSLAGRVDGSPRLLLLHGPPGVGKTHLLRSVLHALEDGRRSVTLLRTSGVELRAELVDAARAGSMARLRSRWAGAEAVAVDDLHVLRGMPMMQQEVGRLLGAALQSGGRVLCAAGCSPAVLPVLAAALRALPEARLVSLRPPSVAEMRRIVVAMARTDGVRLVPAVLASIATTGRGDVRRAAGALSSHRFAQSQ